MMALHIREVCRLIKNKINLKKHRQLAQFSISKIPFFQDRVILGTDYPFPLGEVTGYADAYPGKAIEDCEMIDSKVKQKLLFENGMKFLGLDSSQYL